MYCIILFLVIKLYYDFCFLILHHKLWMLAIDPGTSIVNTGISTLSGWDLFIYFPCLWDPEPPLSSPWDACETISSCACQSDASSSCSQPASSCFPRWWPCHIVIDMLGHRQQIDAGSFHHSIPRGTSPSSWHQYQPHPAHSVPDC